MEQTFNANTTYPREPRAHKLGGVHLKDQAAKVKDVALSILKTMGTNIKEGGMFDLLKISRPACISHHKTYFQTVANDFLFTKYMNKAVACKDPVERMKWLVTFYMSGIYINPAEMQNNGPLNPILGETYWTQKADGTILYCEQISHHPPIASFLLVGPNESYRMYGTSELTVQMNGFNHIFGRKIGKTTVEFADGTKIVFTSPDVRIDGLLVGDRRFNYINTSVFLDKTNKISCEVTFLYEHCGTVAKITSGFRSIFGSATETINSNDNMEIIFFKYDKQKKEGEKKEIIMEGSGSWLSHIQVDGKLLWKVDEKYDDPWIENTKYKLWSDSTYREDSMLIKVKEFDKAQRAKDMLENTQRHDEKLRKEALGRQHN